MEKAQKKKRSVQGKSKKIHLLKPGKIARPGIIGVGAGQGARGKGFATIQQAVISSLNPLSMLSEHLKNGETIKVDYDHINLGSYDLTNITKALYPILARELGDAFTKADCWKGDETIDLVFYYMLEQLAKCQESNHSDIVIIYDPSYYMERPRIFEEITFESDEMHLLEINFLPHFKKHHPAVFESLLIVLNLMSYHIGLMTYDEYPDNYHTHWMDDELENQCNEYSNPEQEYDMLDEKEVKEYNKRRRNWYENMLQDAAILEFYDNFTPSEYITLIKKATPSMKHIDKYRKGLLPLCKINKAMYCACIEVLNFYQNNPKAGYMLRQFFPAEGTADDECMSSDVFFRMVWDANDRLEQRIEDNLQNEWQNSGANTGLALQREFLPGKATKLPSQQLMQDMLKVITGMCNATYKLRDFQNPRINDEKITDNIPDDQIPAVVDSDSLRTFAGERIKRLLSGTAKGVQKRKRRLSARSRTAIKQKPASKAHHGRKQKPRKKRTA